jgi:hypothetical protein
VVRHADQFAREPERSWRRQLISFSIWSNAFHSDAE